MAWIGGARLAHHMVNAVDLVVPGTAVPSICSHKIEGHVELRSLTIKKMRRIGCSVQAIAIMSRTHVGPNADPLVRPKCPTRVGIKTDRRGHRPSVVDGANVLLGCPNSGRERMMPF